jgi:oligopeptide/dipeptide ABC transporter ATP-binding protein
MNAGASRSQPATEPVLRIENLSVEFPTRDGWVRVVDGVNLEVGQGETVGLVGESGSGKTVTIQSVLGLSTLKGGRVTTGQIWFGGRDLVSIPERDIGDIRGGEIAMIFQEPMTSLNPAFKVGRQIADAIMRHQIVSRGEAWNRAVEMLGIVGIPNPKERAHSYPHSFSGGMRQRAMIAMALSCSPKVLLADEPTTALDVTVQARIMDLLGDLQERFGMAIVLVTHDLLLAGDYCDRVAVMYAGQIVEIADSRRIFAAPQHPYTDGLMRSMPQSVGPDGWLQPIAGSVPSPGRLPEGCRFHNRCRHAEAGSCTAAPIELVPHAAQHEVRCVRVGELELTGLTDLNVGGAR